MSKQAKKCGRGKMKKVDLTLLADHQKRVSSKTPKTTSEMSSKEKARFKREKTSSKNISYQHRRKKQKDRDSLKFA